MRTGPFRWRGWQGKSQNREKSPINQTTNHQKMHHARWRLMTMSLFTMEINFSTTVVLTKTRAGNWYSSGIFMTWDAVKRKEEIISRNAIVLREKRVMKWIRRLRSSKIKYSVVEPTAVFWRCQYVRSLQYGTYGTRSMHINESTARKSGWDRFLCQ